MYPTTGQPRVDRPRVMRVPHAAGPQLVHTAAVSAPTEQRDAEPVEVREAVEQPLWVGARLNPPVLARFMHACERGVAPGYLCRACPLPQRRGAEREVVHAIGAAAVVALELVSQQVELAGLEQRAQAGDGGWGGVDVGVAGEDPREAPPDVRGDEEAEERAALCTTRGSKVGSEQVKTVCTASFGVVARRGEGLTL